MYNCAVIGANGFLGKAIAGNLLNAGHIVTAAYNHNTTNIPQGCKVMTITSLLSSSEKFDTLFFSAGSFSSTHKELVTLNCGLLHKLVAAFPSARIIYISSTNVYGLHADVISENTPFNSPGLYGRSKLSGEFIASMADSFALMRLTYLYGKGLDNGSFLPNILQQAKNNKQIRINGKGERKQDYLHVTDAAALCIKAMLSKQNDVFLGATGESHSNMEIAGILASGIEGCKIELQGEETGASFYFNPAETQKKLDWQPAIVFSDGIKEMI